VSTVLGGIGVLLTLAFVSAWIPLPLLVGSALVIRMHMKAEQDFVEMRRGQAILHRRQRYWQELLTEREAASEVRLFGFGDHIVRSWRTVMDQLVKEISDLRRSDIPKSIPSHAINLVLVGFVIGALIFAASQGDIKAGALVALIYVTTQYMAHLNGVGWRLRDLRQFVADLSYVSDYLNVEDERTTDGVVPPILLQEGISFEGVSFTYPGSENPAIDSLDLHIRPGERIAIVGENGAGKTTLTKLVLGLYQPTEGRIIVDGSDLSDMALGQWREGIGVAFQDYVKYALSAKENIALGDLTKLDDADAIERAAKLSSAKGMIDALPNGYETMLGKEYAGGQEISEGQWQKLAISRVYLKDSDILVLDEPASALDALAELEVYRQFLELSQGKTVLLISHRLGSARLADRIIFLEGGRIVEDGSHAELMALNKRYAAMYSIQSGWYT